MSQILNLNCQNGHLYCRFCIEQPLLQSRLPCMPVDKRDKTGNAPQDNKQLSTEIQNAVEKGEGHQTQTVNGAPPLEEMQENGVPKGWKYAKSVVLTPSKGQILTGTLLTSHRDYLMQRLQETHYKISGSQLLKEIQAKGYQGSRSSLQGFMAIVRKDKCPPEFRLGWHREYMVKRLEETQHTISGPQLFKEIQTKGYRGVVGSVTNFLSMLRKNQCLPEAGLPFHQDYLTKRIEQAELQPVTMPALFREIQARGYRGSFRSLKRNVTTIRRNLLFKQIPAEGYRGSIKVVQNFMATNHKNKYFPECRLSFHKDYLTARIEQEGARKIPRLQLFKEIQARGYRGSIFSVERFVAVIRREKRRPESYLRFHENYLIKRIEGALPNYIPATQLLQEVRNKGYGGSYSYFRGYIAQIRAHGLYREEKNGKFNLGELSSRPFRGGMKARHKKQRNSSETTAS